MSLNLLKTKFEESNKTDAKSPQQIAKQIIEALLFASSEPLSIKKIHSIITTQLTLSLKEIKILIEELNHEYQTRDCAFEIEQMGSDYLLKTREKFYSFISQLERERKTSLSQAAKEIIAILVLKGALTRQEIEQIRGKSSSVTIQTLLTHSLIEEKKGESRAKKLLLTNRFLHHFGLKSQGQLKGFLDI